MKRNRGIVTVESSIILTFMTLFTLFLFSFIRVYRAENVVSHATLQAADAIALESYLRENAFRGREDDVLYLSTRLTGSETLNGDSFESMRSANLPVLAREKFIAAISSTDVNADRILNNYGVKDGLSGIDFSSSTMDLDNDDVIVSVAYTVKMQFPIFGATELSVTKTAKAKTFGEILFDITVQPQDPDMGSTSGTGSYKHGTMIQIVANPNYGYKFVSWDDGSTENPRLVPVTAEHTYTAIFEAEEFGIITELSPEGAGEVTGGGTYKYLNSVDISASENPGFHFEKWIVYKHNDDTTIEKEEKDVTQQIDQTYTYTAKFKPNTYTIKVEKSIGAASVQIESGVNSGTTMKIEHGDRFSLFQTTPDGYEFVGWRLLPWNEYIEEDDMKDVDVPTKYPDDKVIPNNAVLTYRAEYQVIQHTVKVSAADNGKATGSGQYNHGSNCKITAKPNSGYEFDYWECNGTQISAGSEYTFSVTANTIFVAHFKKKADPKISLKCSTIPDKGTHTVTIEAITTPADAEVSWSLDKDIAEYKVDSNVKYKHKISLTIKDSKISYSDMKEEKTKDEWLKVDGKDFHHVQDINRKITVEVTASIKIDGEEHEASKKLTIKPSVEVHYVMYRDSDRVRYYYDSRYADNKVPAKYKNFVLGAFDRTWHITYKDYKKQTKEIDDGEKYSGNSKYGSQWGYNKSGKKGKGFRYPKKIGSGQYEVLTFTDSNDFYGDKKSDGTYYDFYFSK